MLVCALRTEFATADMQKKAGAIGLAVVMAASGAAAQPRCARVDEVTAIQAAAIQQQLMVAALTCNDVDRFNEFQTSFNKELRRSDAALLHMFRRLYGGSRGEAEYHAFKTRLANDSSIRSIHDNPGYCRDAGMVFDAALIADKPTLASFVSGIEVTEPGPVGSCAMSVAIGFVGAIPQIVPKPNPLRTAELAASKADAGAPAAATSPAPAAN